MSAETNTQNPSSIPCPHCGTPLESVRAQGVGAVELTEQGCPNPECPMFWGVQKGHFADVGKKVRDAIGLIDSAKWYLSESAQYDQAVDDLKLAIAIVEDLSRG